MSKTLLLISFIFSLHLSAQTVSGVWRGYFILTNINDPGNKANVSQYNYEIQVLENTSGKLSGVTYTYKTKEYFGKANFVGTISGNRQNIIISESAMLAVEKKDNSDVCVMVCSLKYGRSNKGEEILQGTFTSKNIKTNTSCYTGAVFLKRVAKSEFPLEGFLKKAPDASNSKLTIPKTTDTSILQKPAATPKKKYLLELPEEDYTKPSTPVQLEPRKTPTELLERENTLLAAVLQPEQEVTVFIYDNGIIDNDIVSVLVDSSKLFSGIPLSEKAISFKLQFSETNPQHQIVTFAENLGDIPPNTGLLVIQTGKKMIEIPIMSDFKKNSKIIINYKANCKVAVERYN